MLKMMKRLPTVPEYYKQFIDNKVDLTQEPKQCCPFHKENTPSFSYDLNTGRWSCFGACHDHGDVVKMHQKYFKLDSIEQARKSLCSLYGVTEVRTLESVANETPVVSEEKIEDDKVYIEACSLATTPDRWVQLDYAMSISPYDRERLKVLIAEWRGL